jgi:photosystem II stability/assembly factor-like uncharacterized protein
MQCMKREVVLIALIALVIVLSGCQDLDALVGNAFKNLTPDQKKEVKACYKENCKELPKKEREQCARMCYKSAIAPPKVSSPTPTEVCTLFEEDFEDNSADIERGLNWRIVENEGNKFLDAPGEVIDGVEDDWASFGLTGWKDYTVEMDFLMVNEDGFSQRIFSIGNTNYAVFVMERGIFLVKYREGSEEDLGSNDFDYELDRWYNLKMELDGNWIKVSLDGELVINYEDTDPLDRGQVRFETLGDGHVRFDNVVVSGACPRKVWTETWGPENGISMFIEIKHSNPDYVYTGIYDGGLYRTTNQGDAWTRLDNGITRIRGYAVALTYAPSEDSIMYYSAGNKIFRTENSGDTWGALPTFMSHHEFFDSLGMSGSDAAFYGLTVHPEDPNIVFVGTEGNGIWKSEDGGQTWAQFVEGLTRENPSCTGELREPRGCESRLPHPMIRTIEISPSEPEVMYLSTNGDGIFKSVDGGESWEPRNDGITDYFIHTLRVNPSDSSILYAVTGHKRWNVPESGDLLASRDGGESWEVIEIPEFHYEETVDIVIDSKNNNVLYIGTTGSNMFKSVDAGVNWEKINGEPITNRALHHIDVDPDTSGVLYAGSGGQGIFRSFDDGATWEKINEGLSGSPLTAIGIHPTNPNIAYVGDDVGVYKTTNGGGEWVEVLTNIPDVSDIIVNPAVPNVIYVATMGMGVLVSEDSGGSWQPLNDGVGNEYVYALAIHPDNPETLYSGTGEPWNPDAGGEIYKTTNGGESWEMVLDADKPVTTIMIAPSNHEIVYTGTYGNGVYKSENNGNTWETINDGIDYPEIYALAIDPNNEDIVYSGGMSLFSEDFGEIPDNLIFRKSTNGGESWSDPIRTIGSLGAGAEKIITNPKNSNNIYMGTHGSGVYRSNDAGVTWELMNQGYLELDKTTYDHVYVYDLEIDSTGEVMYAGSCGRGAFRGLPNGIDPCAGSSCAIPKVRTSFVGSAIKAVTPKCNNNGICEASRGEDVSCLEDCPVGEVDSSISHITKTHSSADGIKEHEH